MDSRTTGALLGMIAGDAHLNVRNRLKSGKYPYVSSEMRVLHGAQQRAYCEFKCLLTNKLLGRSSTVSKVRNGPGGKYDAYHFSVSHPYFKLLYHWCYPFGKKTFNQIWLDHLTAEGVALWYMDDGNARRNVNSSGRVSSVSTNIATCCSDAEADLICRWFLDVHKIKFTPFLEVKKSDLWSVRANTENSRLFAHLVQPYIVEPMLYKLSHVADLNSHECRAPVSKCVTAGCTNQIYDMRRKGLCSACYSRRYYHQVVKQRVMR
jgi:hypothetical protein